MFRALRYRLSKGRHFHASYDEFWQSSTASRKAHGAGGYRYVWKENRWRVSPVKTG